jgi:hypothetical protein
MQSFSDIRLFQRGKYKKTSPNEASWSFYSYFFNNIDFEEIVFF